MTYLSLLKTFWFHGKLPTFLEDFIISVWYNKPPCWLSVSKSNEEHWFNWVYKIHSYQTSVHVSFSLILSIIFPGVYWNEHDETYYWEHFPPAWPIYLANSFESICLLCPLLLHVPSFQLYAGPLGFFSLLQSLWIKIKIPIFILTKCHVYFSTVPIFYDI